MAVTKTQPAAKIIEAYEAGQRLFGENRVQEFAEKVGALADLRDAEFHMIGHLQSNKAAQGRRDFSRDRFSRLGKAGGTAECRGRETGQDARRADRDQCRRRRSQERYRTGFARTRSILAGAPTWAHLRIRGLMTVPPFTEDPEGARPYFRQLRELRDRLAARNLPGRRLDVLSMGMSHDFEVAIEEGSTCVRIGTAIFGDRAQTMIPIRDTPPARPFR